MAFIDEDNFASLETGASLEATINSHATALGSPQAAIKNTENRSISVEELLNELTTTFSFAATIRSIAFFTAVVVWAWTGRIEQVSQVRSKFVALGEQAQMQPTHLGKVINLAVNSGQEWKLVQVVAELDREFLTNEIEDQQQKLLSDQMNFHQRKGSLNKENLLARTRAAIKTLEDIATRVAQKNDLEREQVNVSTSAHHPQNIPLTLRATTLEEKADFIKQDKDKQIELGADLNQDSRSISKRTMSRVPNAKPIKKLG
ncbi:hypothetical protein NUACC21_23150 [Scytonema sp. NUACC21]